MANQPRSIPLARLEIDAAMALACSIPAADRAQRRVSVHSVISQSTAHRELENGIAFQFDGTHEVAQVLLDLVLAERDCCAQFRYAIGFEPRHGAIELRIEGAGSLVQPLKAMYAAFTNDLSANV